MDEVEKVSVVGMLVDMLADATWCVYSDVASGLELGVLCVCYITHISFKPKS